MGLISLKKRRGGANAELAREESSAGQSPLYTAFDVPGATALDILEQGTVNILKLSASGKADPLPLINAGMLSALVITRTITGSYSIPTGSAATTYANGDPDAPYTSLADASLKFGGKVGDIAASGRSYSQWAREAYQGFQDDMTDVTLPAANSSGATVVTDFTHQIYYLVPVAALLDWPAGMVMMANKGVVVNLNTTWVPWADMLDLPSGGTVTVNSDSAQVDGVLQAVPANAAALPNHYLQYAHTLIEYSKALDNKKTKLDLAQGNDGDIMRIGLCVLTAAGVRDVSNSLGLQTVKFVKNGVDGGIDCSPSTLSFLRNLRARRLTAGQSAEVQVGANGYDGVIWLPLDVGGGRNWVPAAQLAALKVQLEFDASPPNGAEVIFMVEQMQALTVVAAGSATATQAAAGA